MMGVLKKIYYRIYYCIFVGLKRSFREDNKAIAIISSIYLSILLLYNTFSFLLFITLITTKKAYQIPLIWFFITELILNCVLFLRKKRYLQIKALFENEQREVRIIRKTLCVIYIILSLISCPFLLYLVGSLGLYEYVPQ